MSQHKYSMDAVNGSTSEEKEALRGRRTAGLLKLRKIGYVQLPVGFVACVIGVVSLVYGIPGNPQWPYFAGMALWVGVLELIVGTCGILAATEGIGKDETSTKFKILVMANYILAVVSFSPCILTMVWGVISVGWCKNEGDIKNHSKCIPNMDGKVGSGIATIVIAFVAGTISISTAVLFCCYRKTYGLKSRRGRRSERPVQILTTELHTTQQVQTIQQLPISDAPVGYSTHDTNYYQWNQWEQKK